MFMEFYNNMSILDSVFDLILNSYECFMILMKMCVKMFDIPTVHKLFIIHIIVSSFL